MKNVMNAIEQDLVNDPDPARMIYGMRDTGYDFYTASADIIDNSIAAGAEHINISIDLHADGRKVVCFGDDGALSYIVIEKLKPFITCKLL